MAGWQFRVASNAAASAWNDHTGDIERTTARFTGQAFDGQIGQGGVDLDDPLGTIVIPGYRVWELNKDGLVLERGRVGIRDYERGVNRTGDSNERDITLIDCNADLSRIGVHGWSRPAETGYARVLALIDDYLSGSPRASTVIGSTWVRNANTRTMPKKRYDQANPHDVLMDCAEVEAKIFFVTVDDAGAMDLFYDISTYTGYAAGISITDDAPDLVTEFPPVNPTASRDPEELFTKVRVVGPGVSATATNGGVATAHDYLETIYYDDNARSSTVQYRADRFLDIHDEEEVTRRCAVSVPEASLDLIRRGMTISYRSAATNDLTPVTRRIAQLTWQPPIADGQDWLAILELDWPLKMGQRYTKPKKPPPVEPPFTSTCQELFALATLADTSLEGSPTWLGTTNTTLVDGQLVLTNNAQPYLAITTFATPIELHVMQSMEPANVLASMTDYDLTCAVVFYDTNTPSTPGAGAGQDWSGYFWEMSGAPAEVHVQAQSYRTTGGVLLIGDDLVYSGDPTNRTFHTILRLETDGSVNVKAWDSSAAEPATWNAGTAARPNFTPSSVAFYINNNTALNTDPARFIINSFRFTQGFPCESPSPSPGQDVENEHVTAGDGSSYIRHTQDPYVPGSLRVKVNGVWMAVGTIPPDDVEESNPGSGYFTFAYPPLAGAEIVVSYRVAL